MGCYASDVKDMYHWINLRHFSGQAEIDPTMTGVPSNADRSRLTWRNRFPLVAPKLFNMYSSGDEVLSLYAEGGNPGWSDGLWSSGALGARYSWQKQELWKGRAGFLARIGTTNRSGWGF